jgi:hypothetical protein
MTAGGVGGARSGEAAAHGFEVLELHDGPGPRTEPVWQDGRLPDATADGDRLHVAARRLNTTH